MRRVLRFAACFSLALASLGTAHADAAGLQVFGDSFVDAGNANLATGGAVASASLGYFQGRFTNGPTFADIINQRLTGSYTQPFLAGGRNFAVGGARAAGDATFDVTGLPPQVVPGLITQRNLYLGSLGLGAVDDGPFLLSFGNNDVNAIQSGDTYGLSAAAYGDLYASNMSTVVGELLAAGAPRVFVFGVPNPLEPEGQVLQAKLNAALAPLQSAFGNRLVQFDFFSFFNAMLANPVAFGLPANTDFFTPCLSVRTPVDGQIDCTGFFSFDGTHPTAPVHLAIADAFSQQAGLAVPEPASWVMMIAGFGLVGFAVRRRQSALA